MSGYFLLLVVAISTMVVGRDCYFPHGQLHANGIPCDPDAAGAVTCCEQTHTCLSNRLCWDTQKNNVLRGSCTDSNFPSPDCLKKCDGDAQGYKMAYLRQCDGQLDNWTCAPDKTAKDCVAPFRLPVGQVEDYRDSNFSNVIYANGNTTRAGESGGSTANSTENDAQQAKMQVGLGVGLGVGLPLFIALVISLWFLNRTRREVRQLKDRLSYELTSLGDNEHSGKGNTSTAGGYTAMATPIHAPGGFPRATSHSPESSGQHRYHPQELDAHAATVEADSSVARSGSVSRTPAQYYARPAPE